jgi:hypothetical protein
MFFWILAAILAGGLSIPPVSAHPPSDMTLTYNELSKDLQVTITHTVPNPQEHYIKEVIVTINGRVVNDSRYTSQPTPDTFTYTYPVMTKPGDEIEVKASCVLYGSLTRQLYTTGTLATTPPPAAVPPATKASEGLFSFAGVAIVLFLAGRY